MPAFLSFLGGDGCDPPRSTEQAKLVVTEFVNVGQTSTVRKANELTLHQRKLVKPAMREPLSLLPCDECVERGLHGDPCRRRVGRIRVHQSRLLFGALPGASAGADTDEYAGGFHVAHNPLGAMATPVVQVGLRARRVMTSVDAEHEMPPGEK